MLYLVPGNRAVLTSISKYEQAKLLVEQSADLHAPTLSVILIPIPFTSGPQVPSISCVLGLLCAYIPVHSSGCTSSAGAVLLRHPLLYPPVYHTVFIRLRILLQLFLLKIEKHQL